MDRTHESEEMYLETILVLKERNGQVRSVDIVDELNYAKSSVSRGVNLLEDNGYIIIDRETGNINLTKAGLDKAESIYSKHNVFTRIFEFMGADHELATENACRVEHVISDDMFEIVKKFLRTHGKRKI